MACSTRASLSGADGTLPVGACAPRRVGTTGAFRRRLPSPSSWQGASRIQWPATPRTSSISTLKPDGAFRAGVCCKAASATEPAAADNKTSPSAGALVAGANTAEEVLQAVQLLVLPGKETLHWQSQHIHQQRRQSTSEHALRRLGKFLCGASCRFSHHSTITTSDEFRHLCECAATASTEAPDGLADAKVCSASLIALGSLAPLPAYLNVYAELLGSRASSGASELADHHVSGLVWACERLGIETPASLSEAHSARSLPFRIVPGLTDDLVDLQGITSEVPFQAEQLVTREGKKVTERRETCWMAEAGIGGLAYSGKIMTPVPFTPLVRAVRDRLHKQTGEYFDCALLNLYPDEETACKWHSDPDHGRLWATDTIVVSVGETRRFNFRQINKEGKVIEDEPHTFRVYDGDCIWMFDSCQDTYQHCVMKSEGPGNQRPRASIVFKRALAQANGQKGHTVGPGRRSRSRRAAAAAMADSVDGEPRPTGGRGRGGGRTASLTSRGGRGAGRGRSRGRGQSSGAGRRRSSRGSRGGAGQ